MAGGVTIGCQRQASPREGPALLQGHVVCGLCGSRMQVQYHVRRRDGELITSYVCGGRGRLSGDPLCQTLIGTDIDASVSNLLLEVVTLTAFELALAVQQEIAARIEEADRLRYRRVERARYEAERARHRYLQVDAANRLVADSLESDWTAKLAALNEAQHDYERQRATDRVGVDEQERERVLALAADFPAVWRATTTPQRERKRMLALLIEDVTLIKRRQSGAAVRFRGGVTKRERIDRRIHDELRVFIDEHFRVHDFSVRIVEGDVAEQVAGVARDVNAAYVVVGTRGRGQLARLILGDTTQSILQQTPCPVLVVSLRDSAEPSA